MADELYERKMMDMQKYIPFVGSFIEKLKNSNNNDRAVYLEKMETLYDIFVNKDKTSSLQTLQKCEAAILKLYDKIEKKPRLPVTNFRATTPIRSPIENIKLISADRINDPARNGEASSNGGQSGQYDKKIHQQFQNSQNANQSAISSTYSQENISITLKVKGIQYSFPLKVFESSNSNDVKTSNSNSESSISKTHATNTASMHTNTKNTCKPTVNTQSHLIPIPKFIDLNLNPVMLDISKPQSPTQHTFKTNLRSSPERVLKAPKPSTSIHKSRLNTTTIESNQRKEKKSTNGTLDSTHGTLSETPTISVNAKNNEKFAEPVQTGKESHMQIYVEKQSTEKSNEDLMKKLNKKEEDYRKAKTQVIRLKDVRNFMNNKHCTTNEKKIEEDLMKRAVGESKVTERRKIESKIGQVHEETANIPIINIRSKKTKTDIEKVIKTITKKIVVEETEPATLDCMEVDQVNLDKTRSSSINSTTKTIGTSTVDDFQDNPLVLSSSTAVLTDKENAVQSTDDRQKNPSGSSTNENVTKEWIQDFLLSLFNQEKVNKNIVLGIMEKVVDEEKFQQIKTIVNDETAANVQQVSGLKRKLHRKNELDRLNEDLKDMFINDRLSTVKRRRQDPSKQGDELSSIAVTKPSISKSWPISSKTNLVRKDKVATVEKWVASRKRKAEQIGLQRDDFSEKIVDKIHKGERKISDDLQSTNQIVSKEVDMLELLVDQDITQSNKNEKDELYKNVHPEMHSQSKYATLCVLCPFMGNHIANHYVKFHSSSEVLISRLPPKAHKKILANEGNSMPLPLNNALFQYACPFCGIVYHFQARREWVSHFATHTGEYTFACSQCKYMTERQGHMMKHIKRQCPKAHPIRLRSTENDKGRAIFAFICNLCNFIQMNRKNVVDHLITQHDSSEDGITEVMLLNFEANKEEIKQKKTTIVTRKLKVMVKRMNIAAIKKFTRVLKSEEKLSKQKDKDTVKKLENIPLKNSSGLYKSMVNREERKFTNPDSDLLIYGTSTDKKMISVRDQKDEIFKNVHPEMHCQSEHATKCVLCTFSGQNLVNHYLFNHSNVGVLISRLPPATMERIIADKENLSFGHMRDGHQYPLYRYACPFCDNEYFFTRKGWIRHFGTHTGEYAFKCSKCSVMRNNLSEIRSHIMRKCPSAHLIRLQTISHEGAPIFASICNLCNYIQMERHNVVDHLITQHNCSEERLIKVSLLRLETKTSRDLLTSDEDPTEIKSKYLDSNMSETQQNAAFDNSKDNIEYRNRGLIETLISGTDENDGLFKNVHPEMHWQSEYATRCALCSFNGQPLTKHFLRDHPKMGVLISRLPPAAQDRIIANEGNSSLQGVDKYSKRVYRCACPFCNVEYCYRRWDWINHFGTHTGEYRFKCSDCSAVENNLKAMSLHITLRCSKAHPVWLRKMDDERESIFGFICNLCNYIQLNRKNVIEHLVTQHDCLDEEKIIKVCLISLEVKKSKATIMLDTDEKERKYKNIHPEMHWQSKYATKCALCSFSGQNILTHYRHKHPEVGVLISRLSPESQKRIVANEANSLHQYTVKNNKPVYRYACPFCNIEFSCTQREWIYHFGTHTGEYTFKCSECNAVENVLKAMMKHITRQCPNAHAVRIRKLDSESASIFGFICNLCNFIQLSRKNVVEHLVTQHDCFEEKLMKVILLSLEPKKSGDIIIANTEEKEQTFKNIHSEMHCQSEYATKCALCPFTGQNIVIHYRHKHPKMGVLISRLPPEIQKRIIANEANLPLESVDKYNKRVYRYACPFCSVESSYKQRDWVQHFGTHTGEYTFKCSECSALHNRLMKMKEHIRQQCPNAHVVCLRRPDYESESIFGFICNLCNFIQLSRKNVVDHLLTQHDCSKDEIVKVSLLSMQAKKSREVMDTIEKELTFKNVNPDMHYQSEYATKCALCSFMGQNMSTHSRHKHPDVGVLISRLPPETQKRIITNEASPESADNNKKRVYSYACPFCNVDCSYMRRGWIEHISIHTGEYAFKCSECSTVEHKLTAITQHIAEQCPIAHPVRHRDLDDESGSVFGFICNLCNFIQLDRKNVVKHLITQHDCFEEKIIKVSLFGHGIEKSGNPLMADDEGTNIGSLECKTPRLDSSTVEAVQSKITVETEISVIEPSAAEKDTEVIIVLDSDDEDNENNGRNSHANQFKLVNSAYAELGRNCASAANSGKQMMTQPSIAYDQRAVDAPAQTTTNQISPSSNCYPKPPIINRINNLVDDKMPQVSKVIKTTEQKQSTLPNVANQSLAGNLQKNIIKITRLFKLPEENTSLSSVLSPSALTQSILKIPNVQDIGKTKIPPFSSEPQSQIKIASVWSAEEIQSLDSSIPERCQSNGDDELRQSLRENEILQKIKRTTLKPWTLSKSEKSKIYVECLLRDFCLFSLFKCMGNECAFATNSCNKMIEHLNNHLKNEKDLSAEKTNVFSWLECCYCNVWTTEISKLISHIISKHAKDIYQCPYCFYRSCEEYNTFLHLKQYHSTANTAIFVCFGKKQLPSEGLIVAVDGVKQNVKQIKCTDCSEIFINPLAFAEHIKIHKSTTVGAHECAHCTKDISKSISINHLLLQYGIACYECVYCSYASHEKLRINLHMANYHSSNLLFCCIRIALLDATATDEIHTIIDNELVLTLLSEKVDTKYFQSCPFTKEQMNVLCTELLREKILSQDQTTVDSNHYINLAISPNPLDGCSVKHPLNFGPLDTCSGSSKSSMPEIDNLNSNQSTLSDNLSCDFCQYRTAVLSNLLRHLQSHKIEVNMPNIDPVNPELRLNVHAKQFDQITNPANYNLGEGPGSASGAKSSVSGSNLQGTAHFQPTKCHFTEKHYAIKTTCKGGSRLLPIQKYEATFAYKLKWKCVLCETRTVTENEMAKHINFAHNRQHRYQCNKCNFGDDLLSRDRIHHHVKKYHSNEESQIVCSYTELFELS